MLHDLQLIESPLSDCGEELYVESDEKLSVVFNLGDLFNLLPNLEKSNEFFY